MDGVTTKEERLWAMIAHLSAFSGHFIPFGHVLGPLVVWILKKDELPPFEPSLPPLSFGPPAELCSWSAR